MAGKTVAVTDATFEQQVLQADKPVMVDFMAPWCAPCRAIAPALEELADEYGDQIIVAKVNVDDNPQSAVAYDIASMPTLIFFKNGQIVGRLVGARPKSYYATYLQQFLSQDVAIAG